MVKHIHNKIVVFFQLLAIFSIWSGFVYATQPIGVSILKNNVPDLEQFEQAMTRDLQSHFSELFKANVVVSHELLRDGPTQTGVAHPKFYLWVLIKNGDDVLDSGAVRVAAIGKFQFEVTHFMSYKRIKAHPQRLFAIFPKDVCHKIFAKMQ